MNERDVLPEWPPLARPSFTWRERATAFLEGAAIAVLGWLALIGWFALSAT